MSATSFGRLSRDLAIDLGTANTLVWARGRGIVVDEPSVVAVRQTPTGVPGQVLAVGEEARVMLGRTPGSIVALRPLKDGVIADFEVTEEMLRYFITRATGRQGFVRPRILVGIPSGITDVERRAVHESARSAGGREVHLVLEPLAAALGAGLPVMEPTGVMVVDIGGGTTEVAVLSLGGIVQATSLRCAGDEMDQAIMRHVRDEHGLLIGERTAEHIKREVGCAAPREQLATCTVKGRDVDSGIPRQISLTSDDAERALRATVDRILQAVAQTLEATPPELAADLLDRGITLCGGGALLARLEEVIAQATGLPCVTAEDPLRCVVRGAGAAIEDETILERVAL